MPLPFLRNLMNIQCPEEWNTAIRSLFCFGSHSDGSHQMRVRNSGLHPLFHEIRNGKQQTEVDKADLDHFLEQLMRDICDKAVTLDRCDGGITIVLRIPGQLATESTRPEDITVDACFPPREVAVAGEDFIVALTSLVQIYGESIGLPHLLRFQERCVMDHIIPPLAPTQGSPLRASQHEPLPPPEQPGSAYYRCGLLPAGVLSQEIALYNQSKASLPPTSADLEDDEMEEVVKAVDPGPSFWQAALEYATQFDDVRVRQTKGLRANTRTPEYAQALRIGPRTASVFECCALEVGLIPRLCVLIRKRPSEEWETRLLQPDFNLSPRQASLVSTALIQDARKKHSPLSRKRLGFFFVLGVVLGVALLYNYLAFDSFAVFDIGLP